MENTALYRKWRPMTFEEMVGQTQVTVTLKNQIQGQNLSHAYMFSGVRGTGKTSVARLFARAVNCHNHLDTGNPCNQCEACLAILSEQCMDVIEMDAASNNGVDDIREIREHVKFPPSQVKYKVYIIDEVHMLSKGAFNALLKTLEEPPQHVIFLLATTELHKVPATILSRCQRYEFRKIPSELIVKRLDYICSEEGYSASIEALQLIAHYSDGALRDAQSLLNQCMSFAPTGLSYDLAIEALGKAKDFAFESLFTAVSEQDVSLLLNTVKDLTEEGKDLQLLLEDCIDRLRQAMLWHMMKETSVVLKGSVATISLPYLLHMIEALAKLGQDMKWSNAPRVLFEVAWIKLVKPELSFDLAGLDQRLKQLELGHVTVTEQPSPKQAVKQLSNAPLPKVDMPIKAEPIQIDELQVLQSQILTETPRNGDKGLTDVCVGALSLSDITARWHLLLEAVKQELKTTHALLKETTIVGLENNELQVAFPADLAVLSGGLEKEENRKLIENKLFLIYNQQLRLRVMLPVDITEKKPKEDQVLEFFSGFEDKIIMK